MADNQNAIKTLTEALIPVILCHCVFGILGVLGNVFTIKFYSSIAVTSTTCLIKGLAVSDIIVSIMLSVDYLQLLFVTTGDLKVVCQVSEWFSASGITASGLIVVAIAFDRHRKICRPFKKQLTVARAKLVCVGCAMFSLLVSLRAFGEYDIIPVNLTDNCQNCTLVYGYCTTKDFGANRISAVIKGVLEIVCILFGLICWGYAYGNILHTLLNQRSKKKKMVRTKPSLNRAQTNDALASVASLENSASKNQSLNTAESTTLPLEENEENNARTVSAKNTQSSAIVCDRTLSRETENRLTLMLFVSCLTYTIGFASYLWVKVYLRLFQRRGPETELHYSVQVFQNLIYLTGVVNPWIYFVFNLKYRRYFKNSILCKNT